MKILLYLLLPLLLLSTLQATENSFKPAENSATSIKISNDKKLRHLYIYRSKDYFEYSSHFSMLTENSIFKTDTPVIAKRIARKKFKSKN